MYLQVLDIGIGKIQNKKTLEEFFYSGVAFVDVLVEGPKSSCEFFTTNDECHWLVNSSFHQIYKGRMGTQVTVLPDSSNWIFDALDTCEENLAASIDSSWILAAADKMGNFLTMKVSREADENGYSVCARMFEINDRTTKNFTAREQVGSIEVLDDIAEKNTDEILRQFLDKNGINHIPVIALNPLNTNSALMNMVQLTRMSLGIEFRTHFGSSTSRQSLYGYTRSVPWFTTNTNSKRSGFLTRMSPEDRLIELSEVDQPQQKSTMNRKQFLITAVGGNEQELLTSLDRIKGWIEEHLPIAVIEKALDEKNDPAKYKICLVAADTVKLSEEIALAEKGILSSFQSGREWQSRGGSYFTPAPLGADAKVAFVYPGAFNSYVGMGAELLHRFPFLHDWLADHTADPSEIYQADNLFPKSWGSADGDELEAMQMTLLSKPLGMLFTGTAVAGMYTSLLEDIFGVHPNAAYGYSLGEITMFFATGFWKKTQRVKNEITDSPLYRDRIAGDMYAVREFWDQVGLSYDETSPIWGNTILMTSLEKVKTAVEKEPLVYLTHINTPRQVVIGGEPTACQRVVEELGCMKFPIPVNYPMHCAPVASEYNSLRNLVLQPIEEILPITYYGSYNNGPYVMESTEIAGTIAGGLVNQVDFDQLTNTVFNGGISIFIEVGARSNCSKWIERSLKSQHFCATSVNQAEVSDEICLMKVIARLVSHGKAVTLPVVDLEEY